MSYVKKPHAHADSDRQPRDSRWSWLRGTQEEQLQHLQRVLGVFLCSDLTPVFERRFLSSAAADASSRRCSPLCAENIFLWRASARLGGSRLYRFLSRCASVSAGVSLLRERESAPPAAERRPITAQPRGTGAKWVSAGLCGDGWASLRR